MARYHLTLRGILPSFFGGRRRLQEEYTAARDTRIFIFIVSIRVCISVLSNFRYSFFCFIIKRLSTIFLVLAISSESLCRYRHCVCNINFIYEIIPIIISFNTIKLVILISDGVLKVNSYISQWNESMIQIYHVQKTCQNTIHITEHY